MKQFPTVIDGSNKGRAANHGKEHASCPQVCPFCGRHENRHQREKRQGSQGFAPGFKMFVQ